jgi:hypothetical protein
MNLLKTTFSHTTSTPIPPNTQAQDVLALLHDHIAMMDLNPLVIAHTIIPSPDVVPAWNSTYLVTDKMSYGLWTGKTTYQASFRDTADGLETETRAAMGVASEAVWRLEKQITGENANLVLLETAKVTCPRLLRPFVEGQIRTSHQELIQRFLKRLSN